MSPHKPTGPPPGLVFRIALFVLVGTPLVAYLWDTLNHLFAGIIEPVRLVGLLPAGFFFYLLLRAMARAVEGWHGAGDDPVLR